MSILHRLLLILFLFPAVTGAAVAQQTALLSWTPPTTRVDGSAITGTVIYNIYQGAPGFSATLFPSPPAPVVPNLTGMVWPFNLTLTTPQTICWAVTSIETIPPAAGLESGPSNEGCKTFVAVPSLQGLTQVGATAAITAASLAVGTTTLVTSSSAAGTVIGQSPVPGAIVGANTPTFASVVNVTVSTGPALAKPNPPSNVVVK